MAQVHKNLLEQIEEGMTVYDPQNNKIGSVEYVQFGDEDLTKPGAETETRPAPEERDTLVKDLAEALRSPNSLPEEIRDRMLRYGYVKVDTGMLHSDRYAVADQIAKVEGQRVTLKVPREKLIEY